MGRAAKILPACECQRGDEEPDTNAAAMRDTQFLAIGKAGAGQARIGADALATNVQVRPARSDAGRDTTFADVQPPKTRNDVQNAMKTPSHPCPAKYSCCGY